MPIKCKVCGATYLNSDALQKGVHKIRDVYGDLRVEKCRPMLLTTTPDGHPVTSPEEAGTRLVNAVDSTVSLREIEVSLDNIAYLYDDRYYGQYMRPTLGDGTQNHRDLDTVDPTSVRFASPACCLNGEQALYRHGYNRAYFGVRPETIPMPYREVDALVTMTHWAYVEGRFSVGEVQIWVAPKGRMIDPKRDVPAVIIYGENEGDKFGIDVRSAGDFDGDGHEELMISAPFHNTLNLDGTINVDGGIVYVLFLSRIDCSKGPVRIRAEEIGRTVPGVRFEFGADGARYPGWGLSMDRVHFGSRSHCALVIGSFDIYPGKRLKENRQAPAFAPRLYVLQGSPSMPDRIERFRVGIDDGQFGIRVGRYDLEGLPVTVGGMNMTVMGLGDLDEDGFEEFAVSVSDGSTVGCSYVFYGGPDRLEQSCGALIDATLRVHTGRSLHLPDGGTLHFKGLFGANAVEDFDGDGHCEALFVAPKSEVELDGRRWQVGAVVVMSGGVRRQGDLQLADLDYVIHGLPGRTFALGKQNAVRARDITGNGFADLLLNDTGFPEDTCGRTIERGRFWLIEGGPNLPRILSVPTQATLTYVADLGVPGLFGYGWAVGDLNGDGRQEVAIGDHYMGYRNGIRAAGGVYLFGPEETIGSASGEVTRPKSYRPIVLISARSANLDSDRKRLSAPPDREITLFAPDLTDACEGLFDAVGAGGSGSGGLRGSRIVLGASLDRLDPLVRDALVALGQVFDSTRPADVAGGLARWVEGFASGQVGSNVPQRSVSYALFSASLRSRILSHLLQQEATPARRLRLVDHGANIGLLMLCAAYGLPRIGLEVFCSEIDRPAIEAGKALWSYCGLADAIVYQPVSAVDFDYPADIDGIFFGQMLFRIPREARARLLRCAWDALRPGGFMAINEIMNRSDAAASSDLLTSDELLSYFPPGSDIAAYFDFDHPQPVSPSNAHPEAFASSENCVVAIKPSASPVSGVPVETTDMGSNHGTHSAKPKSTHLDPSVEHKPTFNVTMIVPTTLRYDDISANATGTDLAYLEGRSNMEGVTERFIDYIGAKRSDLIGGSGSLLDSGCGNGRFCEAFVRSYDVTGEDLSRGGIYRALERAKERDLSISYRLADSLAINDVFDVVFLRGPSYLEGFPALSGEFAAALAHMVRRARRKLVYVSYSSKPFGVRNRFACWMHDPEHVARAFEPHGGAEVTYLDNYIVATWVALR